MYAVNATDVRKHWSEVIDSVIREKPTFIKRTRDCVVLTNEALFSEMLSAYKFSAIKHIEDDGSITLSLREIDLVANAPTEDEAKLLLAKDILDYANDYYNEFAYWSSAPNRKPHIPYVLRAIMLDDIHKIGECISCQAGKN